MPVAHWTLVQAFPLEAAECSIGAHRLALGTEMPSSESPLLRMAWISLLITGAGILVFGLIAAVHPVGPERALFRSVGVASVGMGLFGIVITVKGYRQRRVWAWAWLALWYYPVFWSVHLV